MSTTLNGGADFGQLQNLRQVLAPQYALLPSAQIRAHMEAVYGSGAAEAYDSYLEGAFDGIGRAFSSAARDVGRFAAKAAPVVATVGGGALQGALAGAQYGPVGIVAGLGIGGAGAGLSQYGSGTARNIGGALSGITNLAGQFSPLGRVGAAVGPAVGSLGRGGSAGGAAVNALSGMVGGLGGGPASGAVGNLLGGLAGGGRGGGQAMNALGSVLGSLGGGTAGGPLGNIMGGLAAGGRGDGVGTAAKALSGVFGGVGGADGALIRLFGGNNGVSRMLSALQRPEMAQALAAMNLGPMGRTTIPVGAAQTPVPTAAFPRLLAQLAENAAAEAAGWAPATDGELAYMQDEEGEFIGDPALPRDRVARVWELLNEAQAERVLGVLAAPPMPRAEVAESYPDQADAWAEDTAHYDSLDMAELYGLPSGPEAVLDYGGWSGEYANEFD